MDDQTPQQKTPFDLPGLNLSVFFTPRRDWNGLVCGHAIDGDDIEAGLVGYAFTLRELLMMQIMNSITDKPDWDTKVFNEEIVSKWRSEISEGDHDVTTAMMDWMIQELQWKATQYRNSGIVTAYDTGVVKSDVAISKDLQQRLRQAVSHLEATSEKDYHPGSDMKVVDLVHPSLFPLIYGRSRALHDTIMGVEDCFSSIGQGKLLELPNEQQLADIGISEVGELNPYSAKFQWLPCNVEFTPDGQIRIASYINNLHPKKHRVLYKIIEEVLTQTIPLWNVSLSCKGTFEYRIPVHSCEYESDEPEPQPETPGVYSNAYWDLHDAWEGRRQVKIPEPGQFEPPKEKPNEKADLQTQFKDRGLQVIVKLANIELTPERPEYEGGSWHIEGQLNERICATAIYYYDSHNITDNTLSFRNRADEEYIQEVSYEQGHFHHLSLFGFNPDDGYGGTDDITQNLGGVSCREGRLLTFPNILQHRVSPFSLADRSKPGHRKILAFFLIDPNRRIISSANVPPQREDWCDEFTDAINEGLSSRFPVELQDMVRQHCDFAPISMDEAKAYRLELMEERSAYADGGNSLFEGGEFNLCEH